MESSGNNSGNTCGLVYTNFPVDGTLPPAAPAPPRPDHSKVSLELDYIELEHRSEDETDSDSRKAGSEERYNDSGVGNSSVDGYTNTDLPINRNLEVGIRSSD
jgi:hypothetical protein